MKRILVLLLIIFSSLDSSSAQLRSINPKWDPAPTTLASSLSLPADGKWTGTQVAATNDGRAVRVYGQLGTGGTMDIKLESGDIYSNVWNAPTSVMGAGDFTWGRATRFTVALNNAGQGVVAWISNNGKPFSEAQWSKTVWVRSFQVTWTNTGLITTWLEPKFMIRNSSSANHRIAMITDGNSFIDIPVEIVAHVSPEGHRIVAWQSNNNTAIPSTESCDGLDPRMRMKVWGAVASQGEPWSFAKNLTRFSDTYIGSIPDESNFGFHQALSIAGAGNQALIIWQERKAFCSTLRPLTVRPWSSTVGWNQLEELSNWADEPSLSMTSSGIATALWVTNGAASYSQQLVGRTRFPDGSWGAPHAVYTQPGGLILHPRLATNGTVGRISFMTGVPYQSPSNFQFITAASFDISQPNSWTDFVSLESSLIPEKKVMQSSLALNSFGDALIAWSSADHTVKAKALFSGRWYSPTISPLRQELPPGIASPTTTINESGFGAVGWTLRAFTTATPFNQEFIRFSSTRRVISKTSYFR